MMRTIRRDIVRSSAVSGALNLCIGLSPGLSHRNCACCGASELVMIITKRLKSLVQYARSIFLLVSLQCDRARRAVFRRDNIVYMTEIRLPRVIRMNDAARPVLDRRVGARLGLFSKGTGLGSHASALRPA